jgi:POT family proton-dependent oligopeptide transporter
VLLVVVALFWIANGEVLNAYMVWAKAHLDRQIGPLELPTTWLQAVSAICRDHAGACADPALERPGQARDRAQPARQDGDRLRAGRPSPMAGWRWAWVSGADKVPLAWALGFTWLCRAATCSSTRSAWRSSRARAGGDHLADHRHLLPLGVRRLAAGGWVGQFYEKMSAPAFWLLHAGAAGMAGLIVVVPVEASERGVGC